MPRGPHPLQLRKLRDLDLAGGSTPDRSPFLSAASGLVKCGDELYVVADDELHLGHFQSAGSSPGKLLRLFAGELPEAHEPRRRRKPDLEILLRLPPSTGCEHGALLALGSGSKRHRCRGAMLPLDAMGAVGESIGIDATPLFSSLASEFDAMNLEGGWVAGSMLWLLQRGNKRASQNALIGIEIGKLLKPLHQEGILPSCTPDVIQNFDLGSLDDVALCFTDGCALTNGEWAFCAVAEDSLDPYLDGRFAGAAVGRVDARHRLQWLTPVSPQYKLEGISAEERGGGLELLLVADADDPDIPSSLLTAEVSAEAG